MVPRRHKRECSTLLDGITIQLRSYARRNVNLRRMTPRKFASLSRVWLLSRSSCRVDHPHKGRLMPLSSHLSNLRQWTLRHVSRAGLCSLVLIGSIALSACTDTADQRAIQPGQVATGFAPTAFGQLTPPSYASSGLAASPRSASPTGGATPNAESITNQPVSNRVYFTDGGDLWQIPVSGGDAAPVLTGHSILAYAPSPDGEQIAVIYTTGDPEQEHLADFRADGTSVIDVALKQPDGGNSSQTGDIQSIAWSPTGDRVAVARQDGSIATVTNDGTITQIVAPDPDRFPGELSISPDGQTLLYLDPALPDHDTSLFTISMSGGSPKQLVVGDGSADSVLEASWLPDGSGIAYIQPAASSPAGTGDVFTVDVRTGASDLAVPSSQFAPVAGVGAMAFSRDGRWAAVTVYVPGENGSGFGGLWLLNRETNATRQVPIDDDLTVTDLWWASGTLLYRTVKATSGKQPQRYGGLRPYALYTVNPTTGESRLRRQTK